MGNATIATVDGIPRKNHVGLLQEYIRDITMSSSYATGGDTLDLAAALSVNTIIMVEFEPVLGYNFKYTSGKILAYNGTTEETNTTDLDGFSIRTKITAK
jgi:hypothetical protein